MKTSRVRPALAAAMLGSVLTSGVTSGVTSNADEIIQSGLGSYHGTVPDGQARPVDSAGQPVLPMTTGDFEEPPATNDWSSSIIFPRFAGQRHGQPMFPWPLACSATPEGFRIERSPTVRPGGNGYYAYLGTGVTVGVTGLLAPETRLARQGDWSITTETRDEEQSLSATIGRGLPYAWFDVEGGDLTLTGSSDLEVIEAHDARVVFSTGGGSYAAFAPLEATWQHSGDTLSSDLGGGGWVVVAALPDASPATVELFDRHARARVVDTRVDWRHRAEAGMVEVTYTLVTEPLEGTETRTLAGLFPHQLAWCGIETTGLWFDTARGRMELIPTTAFTISLPTTPILPGLPLAEDLELTTVLEDLLAIGSEQNSVNAPDSYWSGKQLGRIAQATHLASILGETTLRDSLLDRMRAELENWFSVTPVANEDRIEAESFDESSGVSVEEGESGGLAVRGFGDGDRVSWNGVDLAGGIPTRALVRYASGVGPGGSALLQLRVADDDGPLIGEVALANSGGWDAWTTIPIGVSEEAVKLLDGSQELVLRCQTGYPDDVLDIEWIEWDIPGNGGSVNKTLAYSPEWSTLLPEPGSYGVASELNDHHFHYGYLVAAAATIARFDPEWAAEDRWGGMVELLIRDVANWERSDTRFPFLRNLDPYMGHSYASGHAGFAAGNNQESSSEAMNFAHAVALWGAATGNAEIEELGIFLHALEAQAIEQYWFDVDDEVFPDFMPHPIGAIIWDAGAAYATWWTGNVEEIHGINLLPLTGGSLYLGRHPEVMTGAWNHMIEQNPGPPTVWQDILWSWRALFDPAESLEWLESDDDWSPEAGSSRAHVGFWIRSLAAMGTLDDEVRADTPHAAVLELEGRRSYLAWNPTNGERTITFTDGFTMCLPPGDVLARRTAVTCTAPGDLDGNGVVDGADLTLLLGDWGGCSGCSGDLDGNGTVDGRDLARLLGAWG